LTNFAYMSDRDSQTAGDMRMLRNAAHKGRLALALGSAAALLAAAGAMRADVMVSRGFAKALGTQKAARPLDPAMGRGQRRTGTSGDEGYWLTRAEVESPAPFAKGLSVGDRITIAGRDGRVRTLQVVDLKAIGEPVIKTIAGAAPLRLLLVTCRIIDGPEHDSQAPVRFIIEGDTAEPAALPPTAPKA
jgi:hypothetical protein